MNCKKCGAVLQPGEIFCSNCGERVSESGIAADNTGQVTIEPVVLDPTTQATQTGLTIDPIPVQPLEEIVQEEQISMGVVPVMEPLSEQIVAEEIPMTRTANEIISQTLTGQLQHNDVNNTPVQPAPMVEPTTGPLPEITNVRINNVIQPAVEPNPINELPVVEETPIVEPVQPVVESVQPEAIEIPIEAPTVTEPVSYVQQNDMNPLMGNSEQIGIEVPNMQNPQPMTDTTSMNNVPSLKEISLGSNPGASLGIDPMPSLDGDDLPDRMEPIIPTSPQPIVEETPKREKKKSKIVPVLLVLILLAGAGFGGYYLYTTVLKDKVSGETIEEPTKKTDVDKTTLQEHHVSGYSFSAPNDWILEYSTNQGGMLFANGDQNMLGLIQQVDGQYNVFKSNLEQAKINLTNVGYVVTKNYEKTIEGKSVHVFEATKNGAVVAVYFGESGSNLITVVEAQFESDEEMNTNNETIQKVVASYTKAGDTNLNSTSASTLGQLAPTVFAGMK